ncbi:MAG: phosphoenolpyruvate carboxykinase, partial [Sphaerochaeta sp.]|nr:phosphoenolpyruvate carboxykinase [Sphaerochaeta sp.]
MTKFEAILTKKMSAQSLAKLMALQNEKVLEFIGTFAEHCNPESIYVCDDSEADTQYVRDKALSLGEESTLANSKQTIHWDGYGDQARDKKNTRFMVYKENMASMATLNSVEYEQGLAEIMNIAKGIMRGKEAVVL